ncbi:MAG: hypothetical protein IKE43_10745 [Coriobacteriales bacterium]|nr:hypothetical protein [Coriobacteriales bacterium]
MLEQVDLKAEKMTKEEYKPVHDELISKLVVLQQEARSKGVGLVVLVEGWSGAGKGSRISDLMYELDARATKVYVTEDMNPKEARKFPGLEWGVTGEEPMMKQFWEALGERGEITFFDRGWYSSAVEHVLFGLTKANPKALKELAEKMRKLPVGERGAAVARSALVRDNIGAYRQVAQNFEQMLVDDGYVVVKLFVHVSKRAQKKRLEALSKNPDTAWRVSKRKLAMTEFYDDAYAIYDNLLEGSNFYFAPWTIVNGEDRYVANLQIAQTLVEALERALAANPSKATEQSALAPESSRYHIISNYPHIDHSIEKPRIEADEEYNELLKKEQARFRKLQEEMYQKRVPLMLMYEGWDAAGKGGNIKRVAQAIDARAYQIFPSPAPTKPELAHPHLWRYWTRLPKAGHVGIYDRSWYGRVLVERVEGFATPKQWARAYDEINAFEHELTQWGAILLKFWVDVTPEEQLARFEARAADPTKTWKITDEDWRNREKYPQYKEAVDDMFRLTSTEFAPWTVLESDDKHFARIQALRAINEALEARLHK